MRDGINLYNLCIPVIARMELNGVRSDQTMAKVALDKIEEQQAVEKDKWKSIHGTEFRGSTKYIKGIFQENGWAYKINKKGNPDFSKEVLDNYTMDEETKGLIKKIRQVIPLRALTKSLVENEYLYPNYANAVTGRFRCSDPNIQNLPKSSYEGSPRDCIIPPDNSDFIAMDYSQGEYRLFADYTGNKKIINQLNDGEDFHQITADSAGVERKQAKNVNFATLYGAGIPKLASMLQTNEQEAEHIKHKIFSSLGSEAYRFMERFKRDAIITKWTGLELCVPEEHKRINYLIQGGLADIVRLSLVKTTQYLNQQGLLGKYADIYLNVHDENLYWLSNELSEDYKQEIISNLKRLMETSYVSQNGIHMKVDVMVSDKGRKSFDKIRFKDC